MDKQEYEALRLCVASLDQLLPHLAKVPADVGLLNEALVAARTLLERVEPAPAQTEQQPVAMPTDAQLIEIARRLEALPELCNTVDHPDVRWRINPDVRDLVREVLKGYAAPIAQTAPLRED